MNIIHTPDSTDDDLLSPANCRYNTCCARKKCPKQPVCAVCQSPCIPVFDRIEVEIDEAKIPRGPSKQQVTGTFYNDSFVLTNDGPTPQTMSHSVSIQQKLTSTLAYAKGFTFQQKATLKVCTRLLSSHAVLACFFQKSGITGHVVGCTTPSYSSAICCHVLPRAAYHSSPLGSCNSLQLKK